eukprot:jgi/Tetstr1/453721/TSEL_040677.t1
MGVTSSASGAVVGSKPSTAADAPATGVFNRAEIADRFEPYMADTFQMLGSAARMAGELQYTNEDMVDYNNQLRQGILEAYTGIFQGMSAPKINQWLYASGDNFQHAVFIINFVEKIAADVDGATRT